MQSTVINTHTSAVIKLTTPICLPASSQILQDGNLYHQYTIKYVNPVACPVQIVKKTSSMTITQQFNMSKNTDGLQERHACKSHREDEKCSLG